MTYRETRSLNHPMKVGTQDHGSSHDHHVIKIFHHKNMETNKQKLVTEIVVYFIHHKILIPLPGWGCSPGSDIKTTVN